MGLEPRATFAALFASISQHIEDLANQVKLRVILLLDEAHLLPMAVLDQLHILLNFQRDSKPWLFIILVGLPELREILKRNVLRSQERSLTAHLVSDRNMASLGDDFRTCLVDFVAPLPRSEISSE